MPHPTGRRVVHLSTVHQAKDNRIHNKECRALVDAGFDLTLVVRAPADDLDASVPVVALPEGGGRVSRLVNGQRAAWRALGRLRPELVHIHDPELVPMALLWGRTHGAKVIYDAHEDLVAQISTKSYLPDAVKPAVRWVAQRLVSLADRSVDGVVATTADVAKNYTHHRCVVVRNYPWLSEFPAASPDPVPGRVVYAGDLSEERKLSFMIAVIEKARETRPDAHLVLAGRPLGATQAVLDRVAGSPAVQHVGLLPPAEVPALVASASVGLVLLAPLPNYMRSLPTKLFEYMAASVPFLASAFPYWCDEFGQWDAGRFVDSTDVDATASDLIAMLDDPDARARMGANGRRAIEEGLNFESQVPALVSLTDDLLDQRGRSVLAR